jgi:predicted AlkP superfamily pyrophosphatase or phosphodiesterase
MAQAPVDKNRHVIVISLDAFPAFALRDPAIPLPVLRKLMREGAAADGMVPVNPAVTWPNHTSMVTGVSPAKHGLLFNGLPVRPGDGKPVRIEPWINKSELVLAPTVYDLAHNAGLTTAEVDWVAIHNAATIDWSFAEEPKVDGVIAREMITGGVVTTDEVANLSKKPPPMHDEIWMRAAVHIIEKHRPNLMLMHLLLADTVQHQYGANTLASNTALILADRQIQRILDAVDRAGIRDRTTLLVVSDHGFKTYRRRIRPNVVLRDKGLLRGDDGNLDCDAWAISEGGTAMVYITRESRREQTLPILEQEFAKVPGVASVIRPVEYERYGYPKFVNQGRMADLVLAAESGFSFDGATTGEVVIDVVPGSTPGNHGYLNTDPDMQSIFVAWGAGIQPGARLGLMRSVDVGPVLAKLLNLNLGSIEGTVPAGLFRK